MRAIGVYGRAGPSMAWGRPGGFKAPGSRTAAARDCAASPAQCKISPPRASPRTERLPAFQQPSASRSRKSFPSIFESRKMGEGGQGKDFLSEAMINKTLAGQCWAVLMSNDFTHFEPHWQVNVRPIPDKRACA